MKDFEPTKEPVTDFKSCPFCGDSDASLVPDDHRGFDILCGWCPARTRGDTIAEAIAAWNTRPAPWIPVGERLPEHEEFEPPPMVLVCDQHNRMATGSYHRVDKCWVTSHVATLDVTHWMLSEVPQ